ncbi:hypothetical protein LX32DRAFT_183571 [Colletotrichum zoysiae]|uniref:Uncharacterized protein n=1 Tax=Colletotrichum zoysiae TaxID=1216348 RepID=A0AAD9H5R9_9PEZI|nr:hypothetical protein LX32DRAFT_183571 [Colletotrichum zoysiae]
MTTIRPCTEYYRYVQVCLHLSNLLPLHYNTCTFSFLFGSTSPLSSSAGFHPSAMYRQMMPPVYTRKDVFGFSSSLFLPSFRFSPSFMFCLFFLHPYILSYTYLLPCIHYPASYFVFHISYFPRTRPTRISCCMQVLPVEAFGGRSGSAPPSVSTTSLLEPFNSELQTNVTAACGRKSDNRRRKPRNTVTSWSVEGSQHLRIRTRCDRHGKEATVRCYSTCMACSTLSTRVRSNGFSVDGVRRRMCASTGYGNGEMV